MADDGNRLCTACIHTGQVSEITWLCTRFRHFMCNFSSCVESTCVKFMNASGYCWFTSKQNQTKAKRTEQSKTERSKMQTATETLKTETETQNTNRNGRTRHSGRTIAIITLCAPTLLNHCCHFFALCVQSD